MTDAYRPNVGIVLANQAGNVLWAKRIGKDIWQFPQGGILPGESTKAAMFRELAEELGLNASDVQVMAESETWHCYRTEKPLLKEGKRFIGQKQKWFLLQLTASAHCIDLERSGAPEFDDWRWVTPVDALREVVPFKQQVYQAILSEFANPLSALKEKAEDKQPC